MLKNSSQRIAIVAIDLTSLSQELSVQVQSLVARATQMKAADVVSASHPFSTPNLQGTGADTDEQTRKLGITRLLTKAVAGKRPGREHATADLGGATLRYRFNRF